MIRENKFDGYLRADPHDHICEFLAICNMFKYGETQSEAVKLLIIPFSLCDEAKTWFNELKEESITLWEQMRKAFINRFFPPSLFNRLLLEIRNFSQNVCESLTDTCLRLKNMLRKCHGHGLTKGTIIQIFYHGLDEPTHGILDITVGGIFLYKTPNQAFQFIDDKAMDSQIISLNKELQDIHNKYNELREGNASKNHLNDDTPMCERHEANYIQSEEYQNQNSHDSYSRQSLHDPNDSKKSLKELNNDVRNDFEDFKICIRSMRTIHDKLFDRDDVTSMFFKNNVNDMILKMKQNEKNFQIKIKMMERKMDEWSKSQNISLEQTDSTEPQPPSQAHTEQVNVIFIGSGKSDDPSKTQRDSPPPIIVENKTKKDKPIKTSKKGYHVVKTNEYPFREYIPKTSYPQHLNVDRSHLNRIVKVNTAYPLPSDTAYPAFCPIQRIRPIRLIRQFRSSRRHFKTLSLDELRSPDFNLLSDQEYSEEEEKEAMAETMEQYMSKTRTDYGSGVARPKIDNKDQFELKGQFLKQIQENTFSGSDNEDANEHIEKVLKIVDLFHVPNITVDQLMLRVFPISLTGAASHWLRNEPTASIKT
ncbi:reverse transcriptase domain-containing protein [Tanacetum coccineum]|uniref:Reverse transcriptase domain-containing protein n=1 Tax=Tanacetum coccineum TaxID=301880 RepID=A0ABQ4YMV8_9ASTR